MKFSSRKKHDVLAVFEKGEIIGHFGPKINIVPLGSHPKKKRINKDIGLEGGGQIKLNQCPYIFSFFWMASIYH